MKKFIIISGALIVLFIVVLLIIPIYFKPQLVNLIKKEANNNINATLDFEDIELNLFDNFPDFTLGIQQLRVINQSPFAGDTLFQADNLKATINLKSLIWGDAIKVKSMEMISPRIKLIASKDNEVNWDIIKRPGKDKTESVQAEGKMLNLAVENYGVKNGTIVFSDHKNGTQVLVRQFNHRGTGDFSQELFQLRTVTDIQELTFGLAEINYLNRTKVHLKADIDVDAKNKRFTLLENELQLSELSLACNGYVQQNDTSIDVDLSLNAPKTDFKQILSLIPAIYADNFAELQANGQMQVSGFVKGVYQIDNFPSFQIKAIVNNGMFRYPNLLSQISDVDMELEIDHPAGILDQASLHLNKLHVAIDQEPFDISAHVKTPVSDPAISASLQGAINLEGIKNSMPFQQPVDVSGTIQTELDFAGKASDIKNKQYNNIRANGTAAVSNVNYNDPKLPLPIQIVSANLDFSQDRVTLTDFQSKIGDSDLEADGSFTNVLPFVLNKELLKGILNIHSKSFDLNPFIQGSSRQSQAQAIELPGQIEFTLHSQFDEIIFGKLKLSNVSGYLLLKDKILHLMDLNMNMLNGLVVANGTYGKEKGHPAQVLFNLNAKNFGINPVFETFPTVERFVPLAKNINGNFGADLEFVTALDSTLRPEVQSLNSRGELDIQKASISDFKPLTLAANMLKIEGLKDLIVENIKPSYRIRDGRFYLNPLNFAFRNIDFLVSGSNGVDKSIDYQWKLKIPAKELQSETNAKLNQIFDRKLDLMQDDFVIVDLLFEGTIDKPVIKISGNNIVKSAAQKLSDMAKQEIQEKKTLLADTVRTELEKQKLELEKLKKETEEQAQSEKERLKKEAETKLKSMLKKKKN